MLKAMTEIRTDKAICKGRASLLNTCRGIIIKYLTQRNAVTRKIMEVHIFCLTIAKKVFYHTSKRLLYVHNTHIDTKFIRQCATQEGGANID